MRCRSPWQRPTGGCYIPETGWGSVCLFHQWAKASAPRNNNNTESIYTVPWIQVTQPKETANVTNSVTNSAWFQTLVNISHAVHVPVSLVARALRHDRHSSTCHLQLKWIRQTAVATTYSRPAPANCPV